jgi:phage baseplate assembly protein W
MFNFKVVGGDIVLDGQNNIALVYDDDEFVQAIAEILSTNAGEWFLNDEHGLRRYEILGSKYNREDAADLVREAIFQHEDVDRIENLILDFDRLNRKLAVEFEVVKKTGETVQGEVKV